MHYHCGVVIYPLNIGQVNSLLKQAYKYSFSSTLHTVENMTHVRLICALNYCLLTYLRRYFPAVRGLLIKPESISTLSSSSSSSRSQLGRSTMAPQDGLSIEVDGGTNPVSLRSWFFLTSSRKTGSVDVSTPNHVNAGSPARFDNRCCVLRPLAGTKLHIYCLVT